MINKYKILKDSKYFSSGILQNYYYLMFISANKYFNFLNFFSGINKIYWWKSNGLSEESLENITTADKNCVKL